MRGLLVAMKAFYGANPLHLLALLASFAVAGYSISHVLDDPLLLLMGIWFFGAIIGHDLILFPVYALADLTLSGVSRLVGKRPLVPVVNYVRIPALATGLTFLLFFPGIIEQGADTYHAATGLTQAPFMMRWLVFVGAMFATSALAYAIRVRMAHAPLRATARAARPVIRPGEHLLSTAGTPGQPPEVIASSGACYHRDEHGWVRVGWEELAKATWDEERQLLVLCGKPGNGAGRVELAISAPGSFPQLAQERIAASMITSREVELSDGTVTRISVSRRLTDGGLVWHVRVRDTPAHLPAPDALVDQAIKAMAVELGVSEPDAEDKRTAGPRATRSA